MPNGSIKSRRIEIGFVGRTFLGNQDYISLCEMYISRDIHGYRAATTYTKRSTIVITTTI